MTDKIRTFIAVDIPEGLLQTLDAAIVALKSRWPHARWAPVGNQHVTLRFLGPTPVDQLPAITETVAGIAAEHAAAELSLDELGSFPSKRRMRVLWVGLDDPTGLLAALAGCLSDRLAPLGFEAEERGFSAHLTVARFKQPERLDEPLPDLDLSDRAFLVSDL
ncbi:MAG TPA: RNA 2',3'-cyclic phosphodiesterase, partial [Actinomycetota bacterium]|nr:RNA 2',3'-cyclic phosphodiesterase [Actinomycetota bacterium]